MNILAIASVENADHIRSEIAKQTIQPTEIFIYTDPNPAKGIKNRRKRIAENQEILRNYILKSEADFVWQLEGDSVLPEDCLERLIDSFTVDIPFVSGIQVGRHGIYSIGAWQNITDNSFNSIDPSLVGHQPVDAVGLYCLFTTRFVWLWGETTYDETLPYGPDVTWCLSLPVPIYVDMGLHIGHKIKGGIISPDDPSTCQVFFKRNNDTWEYTTT